MAGTRLPRRSASNTTASLQARSAPRRSACLLCPAVVWPSPSRPFPRLRRGPVVGLGDPPDRARPSSSTSDPPRRAGVHGRATRPSSEPRRRRRHRCHRPIGVRLIPHGLRGNRTDPSSSSALSNRRPSRMSASGRRRRCGGPARRLRPAPRHCRALGPRVLTFFGYRRKVLGISSHPGMTSLLAHHLAPTPSARRDPTRPWSPPTRSGGMNQGVRGTSVAVRRPSPSTPVSRWGW